MDVRLIAAIGQQGQLGLNGDMPWGRGHPEDLKRFRELTTGGLMVAGWRTLQTMRDLDGTANRRLFLDDRERAPEQALCSLAENYPGRTIWIVGGAKTYARYAPWVNEFIIRPVPYEGPADVFLPPLWSTK